MHLWGNTCSIWMKQLLCNQYSAVVPTMKEAFTKTSILMTDEVTRWTTSSTVGNYN